MHCGVGCDHEPSNYLCFVVVEDLKVAFAQVSNRDTKAICYDHGHEHEIELAFKSEGIWRRTVFALLTPQYSRQKATNKRPDNSRFPGHRLSRCLLFVASGICGFI